MALLFENGAMTLTSLIKKCTEHALSQVVEVLRYGARERLHSGASLRGTDEANGGCWYT